MSARQAGKGRLRCTGPKRSAFRRLPGENAGVRSGNTQEVDRQAALLFRKNKGERYSKSLDNLIYLIQVTERQIVGFGRC